MALLAPPPDGLDLQETTDKFFKYLENIESASPLTLKAYRLDLHQAFPDLTERIKKTKKRTESELLTEARQALVGWGRLSAATRNRKSATLKSFFSFLFREGWLERDLAAQIHSPKVPKKIPHFISVDEVIAILKSFERDQSPNEEEKILFLLLYGAGLRVSEACGLQWKKMDLKRRVILIRGKGDKERVVAIPKSLAESLEKFRAHASNGDYVWGEKAMSPRKAYEWIRQRGVKAGLMRPIHPHALRHSFATHLLASGANLRTLQELLGHESLTATEKYTHLGVDQLARTLESHHPFGEKKKRPSS